MVQLDVSFIPIRKMMDTIRVMFIRKVAFKNEYGVQRGSVMDMVVYPGDPLTPGIGATKDAKRYASHTGSPQPA